MVGKLRGMHEQMSVYRIQGEGLTYNKEALVRCTMNNPGHFITLKENFPIVNVKPVNDTISKVYFERGLIRDSIFYHVQDFLFSFWYNPRRFFKMTFAYLVKSYKNRFNKYDS